MSPQSTDGLGDVTQMTARQLGVSEAVAALVLGGRAKEALIAYGDSQSLAEHEWVNLLWTAVNSRRTG